MADFLQTDLGSKDFAVSSYLEELQTDEQRRVLDTVAQVRKCGLDSILSLPQLVVCGDQSAGKSSVLEALTEIPFPRNDNLCTRYATEIDLRRGHINTLTIKVIPDDTRSTAEKETIRAFRETITDFDELPRVMDLATTIMGLSEINTSETQGRAFARDILSIQIEGPKRPQLTLVDIPGLIQTSTKGVTDADIDLVAEITDNYIKSPRTICLAVVAATHDAANQPILRKVRLVDPNGERTLGIITKPDRLPHGSGSESKFLELARNEDVFFKLGWHVVKNRSFEEADTTLLERNSSEARYFRTSNFSSLSKENVGIDALRIRLSLLLFEHVKQELPKLRQDLEEALSEARVELELLGGRRSDADECKTYLAKLSLCFYEVCKAAVNGHYEGSYFHNKTQEVFSIRSPATIARLRAVIQYQNKNFYEVFRQTGHKYQVMKHNDSRTKTGGSSIDKDFDLAQTTPVLLSKADALRWVRDVLARTRGKELIGNFNPLLIGELFWEQSSEWHRLALEHIEQVANVCESFLKYLLDDKCPKDVRSRLWSHQIQDALKHRHQAAMDELEKIMEEVKCFPINYNHYYTDTIHKRRLQRNKAVLAQALKSATTHTQLPQCQSDHTSASVDLDVLVSEFSNRVDPDMENFSCEEALDCLLAIYKVMQKTFVANLATQVIERHIVRDLEKIFSPLVVNSMSNAVVEAIASEPKTAKRHRQFLEDRVSKLQAGQEIFRTVMAGSSSVATQ